MSPAAFVLSKGKRALALIVGIVITLGCGALSGVIAFALVRGGPIRREPGIASLVLFLLMTWYGIYWIQRAFTRQPNRHFTESSRYLSSRNSPWLLLIYPVLGLCLLMVGGLSVGIGFLAIVPTLIVSTAIHELSHSVAVLLIGGRVTSIEVWPIKLERIAARWRISWRASLGGITKADGPATRQRVRRMILVAAGPLADLTIVVSGIALVRLTSHGQDFASNARLALGYVIAGVSTLNLVSGLNPWGKTSDGIPTDGAQLYSLLRLHTSLRSVDLQLLYDCFSGKHPAQWALKLEECRSLILPRAVDQGFTLSIVSGAAFDLAQLDLLEELLQYDRTGMGNDAKASMYLKEACLMALRNGDTVRARSLLELGAPLCTDTSYPLLAEAAVLVAESNLNAARPKWEKWRSDTAQLPTPAIRELGERWVLAELTRRFEALSSHPETMTA